MGRHSVILRPDSVSRVRPPKTTMPKTEAALARSQYATLLDVVSGKYDALPIPLSFPVFEMDIVASLKFDDFLKLRS